MSEDKTGLLGLPTEGADPKELFNKQVTEPEPDGTTTEPVQTTPTEPEEPENKEPEQPTEPSENEKLEVARQEFIKYLGSHNPEEAEKLSHQEKTGRGGYQEALAYANVTAPDVVQQWRDDSMFNKVTNQPIQQPIQPEPEVPQGIKEEFDPYDPVQMQKLMMSAVQKTQEAQQQQQLQQQQQMQQMAIERELNEVKGNFSQLEQNILSQFGQDVGGKILDNAYNKVNSYGIPLNVPGGALRYANAFNDQLTVSLNSIKAQETSEAQKVAQSAEISANLKRTMLQTQPSGSAPDASDLSPGAKHLAELQKHRPQSIAEGFK